jgi:hypothetical protein
MVCYPACKPYGQALIQRYPAGKVLCPLPRCGGSSQVDPGLWLGGGSGRAVAFSSLKYALFPDLTFPVAIVNAQAPWQRCWRQKRPSPCPWKAGVQGIEQINNVTTTTTAGRTVMVMAVPIGTDLGSVVTATETALTDAALPTDTEWDILPLNINEAVAISYAILPEGEVTTALVDQVETAIIPDLEAIPGVLRVDLLGTGTAASPDAPGATTPLAGVNATPFTLVRFNGEDALAIQVVKRADANTLRWCARSKIPWPPCSPVARPYPGAGHHPGQLHSRSHPGHH